MMERKKYLVIILCIFLGITVIWNYGDSSYGYRALGGAVSILVLIYIAKIVDLMTVNLKNDLRKSRRHLVEENKIYHLISQATHDLVCVVYPEQNEIEFDSECLEALFEKKIESTIESVFHAFYEQVHPEHQVEFAQAFGLVQESGYFDKTIIMEYKINIPQKGYRWFRGEVVTLRENDERIAVVGVVRDITEQKQLVQYHEEAAQRDLLTGLYNKHMTEDIVNREVVENGYSGYGYLIDLDGFKEVNDYQGHWQGDQVLITMSVCLKEIFNDHSGVIGRIGGDEFFVFQPIKENVEPQLVAERIIQRFTEELRQRNKQIAIASCSIGISQFTSGKSYSEGVKEADFAMYHTKKNGKQGFSMYDTYLAELRQKELAILTKIEEAVLHDLANISLELVRELDGDQVVAFDVVFGDYSIHLEDTYLEISIKHKQINRISLQKLIKYLEFCMEWQQECSYEINLNIFLYFDRIKEERIFAVLDRFTNQQLNSGLCTLNFNVAYTQYLEEKGVLGEFIRRIKEYGYDIGVHGVERYNINFKLMVDYQINLIIFGNKFIQEVIENRKYIDVLRDLCGVAIKNRIRVGSYCDKRTYGQLKALENIPYLYNEKERFGKSEALKKIESAEWGDFYRYSKLTKIDLDLAGDEQSKARSYFLEIAKYVFSVLQGNLEMEESIHHILAFVGQNVKVSRICIYEQKSGVLENTFQWAQIDTSHVNKEDRHGIFTHFNEGLEYGEENTIFIDDVQQLPKNKREVLKIFNATSILSYRILCGEKVLGYIVFSQCDSFRKWTDDELNLLVLIAKITGNFFVLHYDERALVKTNNMLHNMINYVDAYIFAIDPKTSKIKYFNRKVELLSPDMKIGIECYKAMEGMDKEERCIHCPVERFSGWGQHKEVYYNELRKCWFDTMYSFHEGLDGSDEILCSLVDISDRIHYEQKLEKIAYYDAQVGCYNLEWFHREMDRNLSQGEKGILLGLELHCYRNFCSTFGYQLGGVLLKKIIRMIEKIEGVQSCRVDTERLILLLRNQSREYGMKVVQQIEELFVEPILITDIQYVASMGISLIEYPEVVNNSDEVLRILQLISTEEFTQNGIEYIYVERKLVERLKRRKYIEGQIITGLEQDRFQVVYQPIVDWNDRGSVRGEALLRLVSNDGEHLSPQEFIPVAEEIGMINRLGDFVLEETCKLISELISLGYNMAFMDVNVSAIQFMQVEYISRLETILDTHRVPVEYIQLEVTESIFIDPFEQVAQVLFKLREKGIKIALDDFGTGYSSLSYLVDLPINTIKIDRTLVSRIESLESSKLLVKNIANIAMDCRLETIIEGVETANQVSILNQLGFYQYQGYYFSRPMPKEEFIQFYQQQYS